MNRSHHFALSARSWVVALALSAAADLSFSQVVVIVNARSPVGTMTQEQVSNLYLGKVPSMVSDLPEGSPAREFFYSKATGRTTAQVKAVWARLTFSGKASPPKELPSASEVKKFVAANADAVGYIEKSAVDSTVKVVLELN